MLFLRIYPLSAGSSRAVKGRARQRVLPFQEKWKSPTSAALTVLALGAVTSWRPGARYKRAAVKVCSASLLASQCTACQEASSVSTERGKLAVRPRTPHLAASPGF